MGDIIITILKGDPATGILTMSDQGTTNVIQGDQVTWQIASGSGVGAITGIIEKPMSFDLFNPDPALLPGSTSWQGTVNPNIGSGEEETYTINWTTGGTGWLGKDGAGQAKSYDPTIKIKPSGK